MSRNSYFSRAFTLIELIVVLAVIAILMSLGISDVHQHFGARQSDKGHEQPASDRNRDTNLLK